MIIAGIEYKTGEKVRATFRVPRTDYALPVTIICGKKPGKTVLITAGIHSCEYVGIQAALELERSLQPEDISGTLIVVAVVNRTGVENRLPTLVPEDGKNLNRVFPGNPSGTPSERLAWFFSDRVFPHLDFYIDLHSGGIYEELDHYVYFAGACDPEVSEYAMGAAKCCHVPYMVRSSSTTGAYNSAGKQGVPGILLERGGCGRWTQTEVDEDKTDVCNVLRYLGMLEGEVVEPDEHPFLLRAPEYVELSYSGFWYTELRAGDEIRRGQELGYVTDYDGHVLERLYAGHDGRVLYLTRTLWASCFTEVVAYAKLCDGQECSEEHEHDCGCGHEHMPGCSHHS